MRLSEAILLGSTVSEQAYGTFIDEDGKTCAMGSAMIATNHGTDMGTWPWAWTAQTATLHCPEPSCGFVNDPLDAIETVIWHLNDDHMWTREQIAEWVAKIEPKESYEQEIHELDGSASPGVLLPGSGDRRLVGAQ